MARTDTLGNFLTDVADAIREKKGTNEAIVASDFDTEIENLPSGGGVDLNDYLNLTINSTTTQSNNFISRVFLNKNALPISFSNSGYLDLSYAFYNYKGNLYIDKFEALGVSTINNCFKSCTGITSLDFDKVNFGACVQFTSMCQGCTELTLVEKIKKNGGTCYLGSMFNGCSSLVSVDLSQFNVTVTNCAGMFGDCTALEKVDIRGLDLKNLTTNYNNMFNNVPNDCLIIVADNDNKEWITNKWSNLTNVQTVAEYETGL